MNITKFSSADVYRIAELIKEKEAHLQAASAIDQQLAGLSETGGLPPPFNHPIVNGAKTKPARTTKNATVTEQMLEVLRQAPPGGIHAKEVNRMINGDSRVTYTRLAQLARAKTYPVYKVSAGIYAWDGTGSNGAPPRPKPKPTRRGVHSPLRDAMMAALQRAGSDGLTRKQLAEQLKLEQQVIDNGLTRVFQQDLVKRIGPGHYVAQEVTA